MSRSSDWIRQRITQVVRRRKGEGGTRAPVNARHIW